MGLGDFSQTETTEEEESQSTYVTFKNPGHPEVDISEDSAHRHKQEYFDAVQTLRDALGQDINVPFGEFAAAAVEADDTLGDGPADSSRLEELFNRITE